MIDNEWAEEQLFSAERANIVINRHTNLLARRKMQVDRGSYIHHIDGNRYNEDGDDSILLSDRVE